MKLHSCIIKLLLIFVFIGFMGITPASSTKVTTLPEPYSCYRSYEAITNRLVALTNLYPDLAHLKTIGFSYEDRPIQVLQLGREVETNAKPRLVLVSGLQANALAPMELNLRFAETLLEKYGEDANATWLLEQTEIHVIVIANPDGRLIAEQQAIAGNAPTWTKNKQPYGCTNGNGGVALGQNFDFEWVDDITNACAPDYPGPSAASEPETLAIQTYLEQILAQNPENSFVIDLQANGDKLITPFLFSKTAENPSEDDLFMLASKLAYGSQAMPLRGSSDTFDIINGNLTDFSYGHIQVPSLRFNLGSDLAGGDVTDCWYYKSILEPEGLNMLTRAAILAVEPLTQAQGPEITFTNIENSAYTTHIIGQANDANFYKPLPNPDEFSAVHHVAFSLDTPPWSPNAVLIPVAGERQTEQPYLMDFDHTFHLPEMTPGKHTLYFQAWDTNLSGEQGHAGIINAIEINVPFFTFMPLLIR